MSDTIRIVTQNLATLDPITTFALRFLGILVLASAVAVVLACAGFALAHCCRGDRRRGIPAALVMLLAPTLGGIAAAGAQETRTQVSVPEVEPRFERLWGADSIRLTANMGGPMAERRVSLSPDGRWILLATLNETDGSSLWLAPTEGGEMVPLTDGPYRDDSPQWFPSGAAIAFKSTRPAGTAQNGSYLMRVPISPEDGRPVGPLRQVALDSPFSFDISPDGRSIAYVTDKDPNEMSGALLKVIPFTGGSPTSVTSDHIGMAMALRWGSEGRYLYLLTWSGAPNLEGWVLARVPVEGGEPERLSIWDSWVHLSPRARYLVRELPSAQREERYYEAATLDGRPLARFHLPRTFDLAGFTDQGRELLAVRNDIVNPLRVLPVAGGPIRRLNEAWGYDVPLAWNGDGTEVFFQTELNGEQAFMLAPVDGGPMRQVPLPGNVGWPDLSAEGRHVLYSLQGENEAESGLSIYDIELEATREVELPPRPFEMGPSFSLTGSQLRGVPGGESAIFGYAVTRNGRHEVYLVDRSGTSSLSWSFSADEPTGLDSRFPNVGLHGDRIAFTRNDGREGTLFLIRAGEDRARPLLTLPGRLSTRGSGQPAWSPDGRRLALSYGAPEADGRDALLVEVSESGELVGEPRILSMDGGPDGGWIGLQWMPDSEHFLVVGEEIGGAKMGVWLISLDPNTPPLELTADLHSNVWYYYLSPDGRYIAIESEIPRGSSVWRVDLGDILGGSGSGG